MSMFVLLSGENASLCDVLKLQVPPGKDYFETPPRTPTVPFLQTILFNS